MVTNVRSCARVGRYSLLFMLITVAHDRRNTLLTPSAISCIIINRRAKKATPYATLLFAVLKEFKFMAIMTVGERFPEFELTALKGGDLHDVNAAQPEKDYFETVSLDKYEE